MIPTVVVSLSIAIFALLVHLIINIISKTSERYSSDIIFGIYKRMMLNKIMIILLPLNIFLIIIFEFHILYLKIMEWIILIFSISILIITIMIIIKTIKFISDSGYVIKVLEKYLEKIVKVKKDKDNFLQRKFINTIVGIGDVLSFETRRENNLLVSNGLELINNIILKIFEMRKSNPKKFMKLIYENEIAKILPTNEYYVKLLININPNKYLIGFFTSINQVFRVYTNANDLKNKQIKGISLSFIIQILSFLSNDQGNEIFIEHILDRLIEKFTDSIRYNENEQDIPPELFKWYTLIIFNNTEKINDRFNIEYLELFNYKFELIARYVISEERYFLFTLLIQSLFSFKSSSLSHLSQQLPYDSITSFFSNIKNIAYDASNKADNEKNNALFQAFIPLFNDGKYIDSKNDFDNWKNKFEEIKSDIKPILNVEQEKKAQEIYEEISKCVFSQILYNNLKNELFEIGAYCLFKKKYSYIKYFWNRKQPSDADSTWMGKDITPDNLEDTIRLYFKKDLWFRELIIFEDHHGSKIYFEKYFILLLMRNLQALKTRTSNTTNIDFNFLSRMDIYLLNDIIHSIEELEKISNDLKDDDDILYEIGLINSRDDNEKSSIIIGITEFLNNLKNKTEEIVNTLERILPLSKSKIKSFKEDFINGVYRSANMRKLFKNLFKAINENKNYDSEDIKKQQRFGKTVTEDRAAFFDKWHISYDNMARASGSYFGIDDNSELFKQVTQPCLKITLNEIDEKIKNFKDTNNVVMIATSLAILELFEIPEDKRYKPNIVNSFFNSKPENEKTIDSLRMGNFNYEGTEIPVFKIDTIISYNQILILDKTNIGTLTQYIPLLPGEDKSLIVDDFFYINIIDLADPNNQTYIELMLESFVKNPSAKLGNKQEQENYLKKLVLIQIYERFKFEKAKDFIGYRLY